MEMSAGVENSPHDRCGCGEAAGHVVPPPAWEQGLMLTAALCSSDGGWMKDVRWGGRRSAMQESLAHTAVDQQWGGGGRWQLRTTETLVQGTVETDTSSYFMTT